MAARAFSVARGVPRAEHRQVLVTGPTGDRFVFAELMRLVATHARHVAAFEQRSRGHQRLGLGVARHAAAERLRSSCVLLWWQVVHT
jgi:hypothetical protein